MGKLNFDAFARKQTAFPIQAAGEAAELFVRSQHAMARNQNRNRVRSACAAHGADAGIAHDGDAERCLAVDAAGQVIDGDQILAVLALALVLASALARGKVPLAASQRVSFSFSFAAASLALQALQSRG